MSGPTSAVRAWVLVRLKLKGEVCKYDFTLAGCSMRQMQRVLRDLRSEELIREDTWLRCRGAPVPIYVKADGKPPTPKPEPQPSRERARRRRADPDTLERLNAQKRAYRRRRRPLDTSLIGLLRQV